MQKRLYRSRHDRKLAGVCGGFAEYFDIDPTLIRLVWLFIAFSGTGVFFYIIAALIMKEPPYHGYQEPNYYEGNQDYSHSHSADEGHHEGYGDQPEKKTNNEALLGIFLLAIGGFFLLRNFVNWRWLDMSFLFPVGLVGVGLVILFNSRRNY